MSGIREQGIEAPLAAGVPIVADQRSSVQREEA